MDGDDDVSVADVSGGGGAAVTALDDSSDEGSCNPMVMTARQDFQEEDMGGGSAKIGDSSASRLRRYSSSRSERLFTFNFTTLIWRCANSGFFGHCKKNSRPKNSS